jgi:hypothetical protein
VTSADLGCTIVICFFILCVTVNSISRNCAGAAVKIAQFKHGQPVDTKTADS